MNIKKYLKIWWMFTTITTQKAFTSRIGAAIFLVGKVLRLVLFLLFLLLLTSKTQTLAGYTLWQIIFFFATFNLIDSLPQFFLREVYRFRSYIVSGWFDYFLTKPISPLFRSLFGGSDVMDLSILFLSTVFIFIAGSHIGEVSTAGVFLYIFLIANACLIALSFHIFVLAVGILTTEVDNALWLYRDVTQMGRIPVDIYREPLQAFITFIIPVGIMVTFPPQALMGFLSPGGVILAFAIGAFLFFLSLRFWHFSLRHYSSVSS